jgi:hypothetical protein
MGLPALQSLGSDPVSAVWVTDPALTLALHLAYAVFLAIAPCGSSSLALRLLFRVLDQPVCPLPERPADAADADQWSLWHAGRLPWGPVPLRGIGHRCRLAGVPSPRQCRPRRFSRPRRFVPPVTSRVCFTPLPRPGFALQGLVPDAKPCAFSRASCPLVVHTPSSSAPGHDADRATVGCPPPGFCSVRRFVAGAHSPCVAGSIPS